MLALPTDLEQEISKVAEKYQLSKTATIQLATRKGIGILEEALDGAGK